MKPALKGETTLFSSLFYVEDMGLVSPLFSADVVKASLFSKLLGSAATKAFYWFVVVKTF